MSSVQLSGDAGASVAGCFFHKRPRKPNGGMLDTVQQDTLLAECARLSGMPFPKELG